LVNYGSSIILSLCRLRRGDGFLLRRGDGFLPNRRFFKSLKVEYTPGLPDIKECKLYFAWRSLFHHDEEMRDKTHSKPTAEFFIIFQKNKIDKVMVNVTENKINKKKAGAGFGAILLLDSKIDQVLDISVQVDNCDDENFVFDLIFEVGSHIINEETRNKRSH
jgi:hypothetical protein